MTLLLFALLACLQDLPSRVLQPHPTSTDAALLTPEGKLLVTVGSPDRVAKVWLVDTGKVLFTLADQTQVVAMTVDGIRVAAGGPTGTTLWDPASGNKLHTLESGPAKAMGFTADGKVLTTIAPRGAEALVVSRWEVRTGLQSGSFEIPTTSKLIRTNGVLVAFAHPDKSIRVWDAASPKELAKLPGGRTFALEIRPDGSRVVSYGEDHAYVIWDPSTGKELKRLIDGYGSDPAIGFSPHGEFLALIADAGIEIWDGMAEKKLSTVRMPDTGVFQVSALSFSADGRTLLGGGTLIAKIATKDLKTTGPLYFWKLKR